MCLKSRVCSANEAGNSFTNSLISVYNTLTMNSMFLLLVLLGMHFSHQQFITDLDCFLESNKGYTYKGNVSTRENGQLCKKWKDRPFQGYNEDHNFCRNIYQNVYKPWCFTATQGDDIWGYCSIPYCDTDCLRESDKGVTYNGTVSSIDENLGPPCVKWTDVINTTAGYREAHNFCRNPNNKDKPWCYTSITGYWKYCNIPSCALIKCKTYPEIDNMIRPLERPDGYTYLETIDITCQNGYYVNGTSGIQCGRMGKWSTPAPLCIGLPCPDFPNIENMKHLNRTVGYRHPDTVTVTCQTGYEMNGSSVVMCNAGIWETLPTCLGLPCPTFPNIQNIKQLNKTIEYRHPDTVTVTCQTGYEINGSSVVQCNAGIWSALPTCLGIRILTIEKNELFIAGISTLSIGVVAMIVTAVSLYIAFLYRKRSTKKSTDNYVDLQTSSHSITDPYSTLDQTEYIGGL